MFNTILREAGINPENVRLIRHKDNSAKKGRSPYELWRDDRQKFEQYQSAQTLVNRKKLNASFWAVFVVNHEDKSVFAGLYTVHYHGLLKEDTPMPTNDGIAKAGSLDAYDLTLADSLCDFVGKLYINWGPGALAWIQYADRHNKPVTELHSEFCEPEFPGFMNFIEPLSKLNKLPATWISALKNTCGVYLLTCPKTKELYVGSASGKEGFWGRWQNYLETGHGGNILLKSREPSDYQVSILEVAGTSVTLDDLLLMEGRWQSKFQTWEMGLNRNLAGNIHRKK